MTDAQLQPCTCRLKHGPGNDPSCLKHGAGITRTPEAVTEQPDTAAIRVESESGWYMLDIDETVLALCDALDAARTELREDRYQHINRGVAACMAAQQRAEARAEAAEARIAELEVEREKLIANGKRLAADADKFETWWRDQRNQRHAAEARIAAALAECRRWHAPESDTATWTCQVCRALTGGTE